MDTIEANLFTIALFSVGISVILSLWGLIAVKTASGAGAGGRTMALPMASRLPTYLTLSTTILALVCITASLTVRAIQTGHGPFSNMYEFSVAFSWGILAVGLFFWWRYRIFVLNLLITFIALGLMIFANSLSSRAIPLVPALQQSWLLTTHVASAVISYGAFAIGFSAAILFIIRNRKNDSSQKEAARLDELSYHSVIIGFPFMTLVIVLGALWADIAWGSYWSWDPKETASLVTWLLYATYLHSRIVRGWRDTKAAILLIIGFAAVLLTFFGNYIFIGLHSYG
jgi:cytochrome c-type biogenesis protein CcsB